MTTAASRTHTPPTTRTPPSPRRTVRVLQGATAVALAIAATVVLTDRVELGADTPTGATSAIADAFPVDEQTALDRLVALGYLASPVADPEAEATARWVARGQVPAAALVTHEQQVTADLVARGLVPPGSSR